MRESSSQVATVTAIVVLSVLTVIGASAPVGAGPSAASDTVTTAPTATAPIAAQQGSPECSFPVTVTDASGTDVSLREEPERIVVLAPSDAQTLWAIGARGNVVGMPTGQYTSYLNGTQGKTDVTNNDGSVNAEQVVGLQPDIVFAASVTPNETVAQLRGAGLTVYSTGLATSIEDVYGVTERYGRLTGNCEGANETVREMRTRVNEIEEAIDGSDRPPALYYFYNFTAGQGTHINDVLQAAGARNIAAQAGITGYERISAEIVASRNPEWIVHPADSPVPQGQPIVARPRSKRIGRWHYKRTSSNSPPRGSSTRSRSSHGRSTPKRCAKRTSRRSTSPRKRGRRTPRARTGRAGPPSRR